MRQIPSDLTQAIEEWRTVYHRLATQPRTFLRRKLIRLSGEVLFHSHWEQWQTTSARSALHTTGRGGRS
ncbi:hypothetical protein ABTX60_42300 [Streptomyces sp. NPDC126510]|uniref:hypothetical protein n=1 Tax=Streptomyces sp. NPDC126510 TaxID=3155317 RepID=UPI00332BF4DE